MGTRWVVLKLWPTKRTNKNNGEMIEVWKDIPGYNGKYRVSNHGRIRSMNYRRTGKTRLFIPLDNGNGYYFVGLRDGMERRFFYIHRLVAESFLDNPDKLPQINHKDHDRGNNNVENLEWCSASHNIMYGTTHTRAIATQQNTHPSRKAVIQYDMSGNVISVFGSQKEAERETGIASSNISMCCNGKIRTAGGFVFAIKRDGR